MTSERTGGRPLLRLLRLAGPWRGRLALSVLAGAAATGFGVALLATSGFMLARASEHPRWSRSACSAWAAEYPATSSA
jgi:ABC-type transport system involved in cytochrome bd biosynthesis fused ATPase/permease subunit